MKGLEGRKTIVTGAGSGIGKAIAARLIEEGCLVLAVDRDAAGLKEFQGTNTKTLLADVTAADAPATIVGTALAALGGLDILVNNAGLGNAPALHETSDADLDKWLDVNLRSVFRLSREALPHLKATRGAIVNISSSVAVRGYKRGAPYAAAKAGILGLTRNMAADFGPDGVRVNAVAPGVVRTPLTEDRLKTKRFQANVVGTMPLGRPAETAHIAATVAFLASADASFVTGQVIAVDGGQTGSVYIAEDLVSAYELQGGV